MTPATPRPAAPLLTVTDLHVTFADGAHAVRGMGFDVAPGETLALIGESGAGKTATALATMGLLPPKAEATGSVRLRGRELLGLGDKDLAPIRGNNLAMIFQDPEFTPVHRIGDHITEAIRTHTHTPRRTAAARAIELLALAGVPDATRVTRAYPHELSGGLRRRAAIAVAVAADPEVILADEPTAALDPTVQAEVLNTLQAMCGRTGAALVLITHDLAMAGTRADRAIVMYAGRPVEAGTVDAVFHHPRMPYTIGLLAAAPHLDRPNTHPQPIPGHPPSPTNTEPGCAFAPRCPLTTNECLTAEPELTPVIHTAQVAHTDPVDQPDHADYASPADRANPVDQAAYADHAGPIDYADPADQADPVDRVDYADQADHVGRADRVDATDPVACVDYADPVDCTGEAGPVDQAGDADPADPVERVHHTDQADYRDHVDNADQVNSLDHRAACVRVAAIGTHGPTSTTPVFGVRPHSPTPLPAEGSDRHRRREGSRRDSLPAFLRLPASPGFDGGGGAQVEVPGFPTLASDLPSPSCGDPAVLEVNNLVKHYPLIEGTILRRRTGTIRAVDGIDFDVHAGETLGLIGESGCGKTTTLLEILRLSAPPAGRVVVFGRDTTTLSATERHELRRDIQIVFQDPLAALDPRMTVGAILAEPLRAHGRPGIATRIPEALRVHGRRDIGDRIPELLGLVGLEPAHASCYPGELSGGQRQRVAIARALALGPKLLVMDEPFSALDVSTQAGIIALLRELKARLGLAYLIAAHDLAALRQLADRVAVMRLGRIVEIGEADAVYETPAHPYTRALLSAVPVPDPHRERARRHIPLRRDPSTARESTGPSTDTPAAAPSYAPRLSPQPLTTPGPAPRHARPSAKPPAKPSAGSPARPSAGSSARPSAGSSDRPRREPSRRPPSVSGEEPPSIRPAHFPGPPSPQPHDPRPDAPSDRSSTERPPRLPSEPSDHPPDHPSEGSSAGLTGAPGADRLFGRRPGGSLVGVLGGPGDELPDRPFGCQPGGSLVGVPGGPGDEFSDGPFEHQLGGTSVREPPGPGDVRSDRRRGRSSGRGAGRLYVRAPCGPVDPLRPPGRPSGRGAGCEFREHCPVFATLAVGDRRRCVEEEPAVRSVDLRQAVACHYPWNMTRSL